MGGAGRGGGRGEGRSMRETVGERGVGGEAMGGGGRMTSLGGMKQHEKGLRERVERETKEGQRKREQD